MPKASGGMSSRGAKRMRRCSRPLFRGIEKRLSAILHLSHLWEGWTIMSNQTEGNVMLGMVAGAVGGLIASWMMNAFIEGPGQKLQGAIQGENGKMPQPRDAMSHPRMTPR
jgi:hypothetical protein